MQPCLYSFRPVSLLLRRPQKELRLKAPADGLQLPVQQTDLTGESTLTAA